MTLVFALLLAAGSEGGTTPLLPAPGTTPLKSITLGGRSVALDAGGRGAIPAATPLDSPGWRFYRTPGLMSPRDAVYYYPSSYSLVRLPLSQVQTPAGVGEIVLKERTGKSWGDGRGYEVHLEQDRGAGQAVRFVIPSGEWDVALLVPGYAPEFSTGVRGMAPSVTLKPLSLRRGTGVKAEILDSHTGRPPNRWSAYVTKLTADNQTEEARFFSTRPVASDQNALDFRSLPIGGWELRVDAPGVGRRRTIVSALEPGDSVDLGKFFVSSFGAVRVTLQFPGEIPPGDFTINLYKDSSDPTDASRTTVGSKIVTPEPESVVMFSDLEPGLLTVEAENASGQIRRGTRVAVEASRSSEAHLVFSPVAVSGIVRRGDESVEGASVQAMGEGLEENPPATTDRDGEYALKVWAPPGEITLMTFPPEEQVPFPETLRVDPEATRIEHDVLLPASQIRGIVRDAETGQPLVGAHVDYGSSPTQPGLPVDEFGFSLRKETDREGRFRLGNLTRQPIDVSVSHEGYAPAVHSAVKPTDAGVELDIKLTKGFQLTGVVVDEAGRPVPGATIGLDADPHGLDFDRTAKSSASGEFEFRGVDAGLHVLIAWRCGSSMAVHPVSVTGERRSVERIALTSDSNPIVAHFIDEAGRPVSRATARWVVNGQLLPVEEWGRLVVGCGLSPFSDGDGNLTLHGFPPGALAALSLFERRPLGSFQNDGTRPVWTIRISQGAR